MNYSDTILTKKDKELLRYCELHCQTDRALFSKEDFYRLVELTGRDRNDFRIYNHLVTIHEEQMEGIIKKIKVRNSKNKWLFSEKVILNLTHNKTL